MKRRWNAALWIGFLLVVAGALTYIPVFARFAATRDVPWANFALFALGAALIATGLRRAYRQADLFRGKVAGIVLGALSVALIGLFTFTIFVSFRRLPGARGAPQVGQKAPEFRLLDGDGNPQTLASLASSARGVVLIFYRGFW